MIIQHTVFATVAAAQAVADANNADAEACDGEHAWGYRVVPDLAGTGKAVVLVVDEDGLDLGFL